MERTECALQLLDQAVSGDLPEVRYRASDRQTIVAMIDEGLGITIAPRGALLDKRNGITALALDPPHPLDIGLAVKSFETVPRSARLLVETAQSLAPGKRGTL